MKRLIKWISDISGVTQDIQINTIKQVGECMYQNAYWWNGGITYKEPKPEVANAFFLYAIELKRGVYSPDISKIRDEVYKLGYNYSDRTPPGYKTLKKLEELK